MKVTKVIVVPHVHWDREWYFTCEESQILAVRDFDEVLDYLETHPDYPSYVLDGQTAVVEEYLQTVPGARLRMERLVRAGRLHVGPWYTQTDEMVVGAESIVRNLLYGTTAARELGAVMRIGYVPDSFGQSAQMPSILNGFGIERAIFWRGQSQFVGTEANQFWWESADGSRVLVEQLPFGYATAKYLPTDAEGLRGRLDRLFSVMDELAPTPVAVLPNGHDQMPIQTNINEVLEGLRSVYPEREFTLGSFDDALDQVELYAADHPLPTVRSEFMYGKRERVHRSIYSVRTDNKAANTRIENLLSRRVEPLLAVAHAVGVDCPRELVRSAWRLLLENHAHDSMGGCCSDVVNAQIKARYVEAGERARLLGHYYERYLTDAADVAHEGRLGLFNMSCAPGERLVTADVLTRGGRFELLDEKSNPIDYDVIGVRDMNPGLVDRQIVAAGHYEPFCCTTIQLRRAVPTVGYEVLGVREVEGERPRSPERHCGAATFETAVYQVRVNNDGTLDLSTAAGAVCQGAFAVECEGNDGDEYDFSPVRDGKKIVSAEVVRCEPEVVERQHSVAVRIAYTLELPAGLDGWRAADSAGLDCDESSCVSKRTSELDVALELEFDRESPVIGVHVELNNMANDFRARLLVPTDIASEVSFAGTQFGRVARPVVDPALKVWEREGWAERPDSIFPFADYVALSDEERTIAVLTNGPREYEVVGEKYDALAVTLLSCVGMLGKPDLERRPGRPSGISVATPDAQCHGRIEFDVALACLDVPIAQAHLGALSSLWLTPVDSYQRFDHAPIQLNDSAYTVPRSYSLFALAEEGLVPSAIKIEEDSDCVLARFYNEEDDGADLRITGARVNRRLRLDETPADTDSLEVGPHAIITVEIGAGA